MIIEIISSVWKTEVIPIYEFRVFYTTALSLYNLIPKNCVSSHKTTPLTLHSPMLKLDSSISHIAAGPAQPSQPRHNDNFLNKINYLIFITSNFHLPTKLTKITSGVKVRQSITTITFNTSCWLS